MNRWASCGWAILAVVGGLRCSSSEQPPSANTGAACVIASQCFGALEAGALRGNTVCISKIPGGYCTHTCTADADCCAAAGECPTGRTEVCAPFESTGEMYCLVSCEAADVTLAAAADGNALCTSAAGPAFSCRSTGGGSANRKFCTP
jgi:hypothetical protein